MIRLILIASILLSVFAIQAQSNAERIAQIDKEIEAAVQNQEYDKAQKLKEEKDTRLKIEEALKEGDFKKAGELKKTLGEEVSVIKKKDNTEKEKLKKAKAEKNGKYTKIPFEVVKDENVHVEFPQTRLIDNQWVYPIGTIDGIEISYLIEVDSDVDFDGYSDTYYDIDIIFKNTTGKDIYYNNPMEKVGAVNFTGEEVEIYLENYTIRNLGGKCTFFAAFLDEEDGRYVMKAGEEYFGYYSINQDSESWLELIWLRRLKPLSARVKIPEKYFDASAKTDFRFYPEYKQTKIDNRISRDGFVESKIKLPGKKIECTPIPRDVKLKKLLETDGKYTVVYENDHVRIGYWIDLGNPKFKSSSGYFYFPISINVKNKSKQILSGWKIDKEKMILGYLDFMNSAPVPIKIEKSGYVGTMELKPGESADYNTTLRVTGFSGELFEAGKFSKRAVVQNRPFVPNYIMLANQIVDGPGGQGVASSDGKTKVHFYVEKASGGDMYASLWNKDKYLIYLGTDVSKHTETKAGNSYTFELIEAGDKELFLSLNKKTDEKKMAKVRNGKLVVSLSYNPFSVKKGEEVFITYRYMKGFDIVSKEEYEKILSRSNSNVSNQVIKE